MTEQELITRSVRLPAHVAAAVDKIADAQRRSFSNFVMTVLEELVSAKAENEKADTEKVSAQ